MKLSILIPTIPEHAHFCEQLESEFTRQINELSDVYNKNMHSEIKMIFDPRPKGLSIGEKRNFLLDLSDSDYLQFFDSDDKPTPDYLATVFPLLEQNPDCLSLRGIMTTNGLNPEVFEHSLKYNVWKTTENAIKYERYPNHLNIIKSSLAKQVRFENVSHGEDHRWSTKIHELGLLKNEIYIDKVLYNYNYLSK